MIDHLDKETQPLPLETKRSRGRPGTGKALSNAERQRLYRERQKAQRNENSEKHAVPYEEVVSIAQELGERCKQAEARVKELEKQLAQRNELPAKAKRHRDQPAAKLPEEGIPDEGVWTVQFMMKNFRKRTWDSCEKPQIDFEGTPENFETVKRHIDEMIKSDTMGNAWRAVRDDGLVYEPKAPKSQRKRPAKP